MNKYFSSRQAARDFAKANELRVYDAGTECKKGERFYCIVESYSEATSTPKREIIKVSKKCAPVYRKETTFNNRTSYKEPLIKRLMHNYYTIHASYTPQNHVTFG